MSKGAMQKASRGFLRGKDGLEERKYGLQRLLGHSTHPGGYRYLYVRFQTVTIPKSMDIQVRC